MLASGDPMFYGVGASLARQVPADELQVLPAPSSVSLAAARLGWTLPTFNRKLDNVCDKLDKFGVSGLRGGRNKLASNRRARLVEYAISTRLVTPEDLDTLDRR